MRTIHKKNTSESNWQQVRNLMFFNGLQPKNFYFNLLLSGWEDHELYNKLGKSIGNAAKKNFTNAVNNLKTFTDQQNNSTDRLQIIIPLLEQIITQEANNEKAYFKQKYSTFKNAFSAEELKALPELEYLLNFLKNPTIDGAIDYNNFILAINIALQGYDNAISIMKYEGQRVNDLEKRLNAALSLRRSQVKGLAKSREKDEKDQIEAGNKAVGKFEHNIQQHFLKYGNLKDPKDKKGKRYMRGLNQFLTELPATVDVLITEWLKENIKLAFESEEVRTELINILKNCWPNMLRSGSTIDAEKQMLTFLIQKFQNFSVTHIAEIIENRVQETYKEIINYTNENLNFDLNIEGYSPEVFINIMTPQYFKQQNSKKHTAGEGLFDIVSQFRKKIQKAVRDGTQKSLKQEERETYNLIFQKSKVGKLNNLNYQNIFLLIEELEALNRKVEKAKKNKKNTNVELSNNQIKRLNLKEKMTIRIENGEIINESEIMQVINSRARELGVNLQTTKHINTAINTIKAQTSHNIKTLLDDYIKGKRLVANKTPKQISDMVETALTKISIHITAPTEAEIIEGLQFTMRGNNLVLQWTGPSNVKNDFVVIDVNLPDDKALKITVKDLFGDITTKVEETITKEMEQARKEVAHTVGQNLTNIAQTFASQQKYNQHKAIADKAEQEKDAFFKLEEDYDALLLEDMPNLKNLLHRLDDLYQNNPQEALQKKHSLLETFYNFFYQSSTTKTYNNFLNKVGFQGGSIGPNVTAQVMKINEMFSEAGIPLNQKDIDWLIGAVINCSNFSIMGNEQRQDIEYYLGALATLTLFDEASFEKSIIAQMQDASRKGASMNIFHLYRLNGLYYPGSFVLKQAKDSLAIYIGQIQETIKTTRHGGVGIIGGGLTINDLPNKGLKNPIDTNPWETVSSQAQENAQIKVLFLAGLLDTLNAIQEKINNIELPG